MEDEQVIKKTVKKDVPPDLNAIKWWLDTAEIKKETESELTVEEARAMLIERKRLLKEDR